ncbi:DUF397 domain-containing protein [Streptomyces sp. NPDC059979]|uniref:DUF397 domain-containing protein n=1 Tax=Streptomyces sp. NPDC059979 TaxID=3347021 RepID=UPI00368A8C7C
MIHEPELEWFKSSYSDSGDINDCVEVAHTPATVHVRDSKVLHGLDIAFAPEAWAGFVAQVS